MRVCVYAQPVLGNEPRLPGTTRGPARPTQTTTSRYGSPTSPAQPFVSRGVPCHPEPACHVCSALSRAAGCSSSQCRVG